MAARVGVITYALRMLFTQLRFLSVVLFMAGLTLDVVRAESVTTLDRAAQCDRLGNADFSRVQDAPSQVTSAQFVPATDDLPEHCEIVGYVAPSVGFELRLPSYWNGKFIQIGSGGHGGTLDWIKWCPARKGYACLVTDMGHRGTGKDGLWADQSLQAKLDWGYRATHVATLAGKAIAEYFYGRPLSRSYFMGCSTGGRQGLQEAQRFPWDYDGIIAGAPPIRLSLLYLNYVWGYRAIHESHGKAVLGGDQLRLLTAAAVQRCDGDDGVKDGVIGDPAHCSFDPVELACKPEGSGRCLTPLQVEAVRKLYTGPVTTAGSKLTLGGLWPGSEEALAPVFLGTDEQPSPVETLFGNGLRYLFFWPDPGTTWKLSDLDFDRDYRRMGLMESLVDSSNPDLRRFKVEGGKLLLFQGLNDPLIARPAIDYYDAVERTMGGRKATQDFFRLFTLPGVEHCSGGVGADAVDLLGYLEGWVERGIAPDRIVAAHMKGSPLPFAYPYREFPADPGMVSFTRPVYPYPVRAKYKGRGDPNDANNFEPVH